MRKIRPFIVKSQCSKLMKNLICVDYDITPLRPQIIQTELFL